MAVRRIYGRSTQSERNESGAIKNRHATIAGTQQRSKGAMRRIIIGSLAGFGAVAVMIIGITAGLAMATDAQKSVTGSLEDTFCFTVLGAHGAGHAQCALKCAQKGIPVGLVEKGTEKMYILLPPKNEEALPDDVLKNMEKEVTITGKEYSKDGVEFLTVDSVK